MTATASSGTPTLPPPPAPPIDSTGASGSSSSDDGDKRPKPGQYASEPLDVLLRDWRNLKGMEDATEPQDVLTLVLRAALADHVDAFRAAGLGYELALDVVVETLAHLPEVPTE